MSRKTILKSILAVSLIAVAMGVHSFRTPKGDRFDYFNELNRYDVCIIDRNYYGEKPYELEPQAALNETQKAQLQELILNTKYTATDYFEGFESMYSIILFDEAKPLTAMYVFDTNAAELETFLKPSPYQFLISHDDQFFDKITQIIWRDQ